MIGEYEDGLRKSRDKVIQALDTMARIDAQMPDRKLYQGRKEATEALIKAKKAIDQALDE